MLLPGDRHGVRTLEQARGSTSEPGGWAAVRRSRMVPSSASTSSALVDWVEESMPSTRAMSHIKYDSRRKVNVDRRTGPFRAVEWPVVVRTGWVGFDKLNLRRRL